MSTFKFNVYYSSEQPNDYFIKDKSYELMYAPKTDSLYVVKDECARPHACDISLVCAYFKLQSGGDLAGALENAKELANRRPCMPKVEPKEPKPDNKLLEELHKQLQFHIDICDGLSLIETTNMTLKQRIRLDMLQLKTLEKIEKMKIKIENENRISILEGEVK